MPAYLILTLAVLSRLVPSLLGSVGRNITLVGGSLLYFGARRPRGEFALAAIAFAATDVALTTVAFRMPFQLADYTLTWLWYLAIPLVGHALLHQAHAGFFNFAHIPTEAPEVTARRRADASQRFRRLRTLRLALGVVAATFLSATLFFLLSNGQVWFQNHMYPHTAAGLVACYTAGLPFYRNDLASTGLTVTALFGLPAAAQALYRRLAVPARA